jgi:hypothetical protein
VAREPGGLVIRQLGKRELARRRAERDRDVAGPPPLKWASTLSPEEVAELEARAGVRHQRRVRVADDVAFRRALPDA